MARLINELLARLRLDEAILIGNDTGGAICRVAATELPARIGGLVLTSCDAFDNFLPPTFRYLQRGARVPGFLWLAAQSMRVRAFRQMRMAYGALAKHGLTDEVTRAFVAPMIADSGTRRDARKVLRDISPRYTLTAAEKLRDFRQPLLLAWSAEDPFFPIEHAHRLAALAPNARVVPIGDAWTVSAWDQPERLGAAIRDWLHG